MPPLDIVWRIVIHIVKGLAICVHDIQYRYG